MSYEQSIADALQGEDFTNDEMEKIIAGFVAVDVDRNGFIDKDEVGEVLKVCEKPTPSYKIRLLMNELDTNKDGKLNPVEFSNIYKKVTAEEIAKTFKKAVTVKTGLKKAGVSESSAEGTQHSYSDEECLAFTNWIHKKLKEDPDCAALVGDLDAEDLFKAVGDGIILCKLINHSAPDTIDERAINKKDKNFSIYKKRENLNLALNSASSIGCNIVNIGAVDIVEGKAHLILGLLWQVIRIGLFAKIDLTRTPDLAALLEGDEELSDLMNLSPEELLLRWVNYHLANSEGYMQRYPQGKKIKNFSGDIKDSIAYCYLLQEIQPVDEEEKSYVLDPHINGNEDADKSTAMDRAEAMLSSADRMDCREFVSPKDIVKGHPKLNLAFVANLFNTHPALKKVELDQEIEDEDREVKTFRNWMNSLGLTPRVNRLPRDIHDGLVLLKLYGHIDENAVEWKRVNKSPFKPKDAMLKKTENCNYAVEVGKQMGYKIVGIAGKDLYDCNEKLTLAIVWQLMRGYTFKILESINEADDGKAVDDAIIVKWVNDTLEKAGKTSKINSFKDKSISSSLCVMDLIESIKPGSINYDNYKECDSEEAKLSNAKYAISMARKIGSRIYALPEDLVEVKPKMVLTVFACLMATGLKNVNEDGQAEGN